MATSIAFPDDVKYTNCSSHPMGEECSKKWLLAIAIVKLDEITLIN